MRPRRITYGIDQGRDARTGKHRAGQPRLDVKGLQVTAHFAVRESHRNPATGECDWQLDHLPTGASCGRQYRTREAAIACAARLEEILGNAAGSTDPKAVVRKGGRRAAQAVREHLS